MGMAHRDWQDMMAKLERIAVALETIAATTSDIAELKAATKGLTEHAAPLQDALGK